MIWPLTLLPRWSGIPRPSDQRFDGLIILITGASGGLGLEAAKKLAAAGTSKLIITTRDPKKGQATKAVIETHLRRHGYQEPSNIVPLELEMSDPASLQSFITSLRQETKHLDHAILSAGLMTAEHKVLPTGYETSIQVNAISTALLALYILPFLNASPLTSETNIALRPHLSFTSSYAAFMFDPSKTPFLQTTPTPLLALSAAEKFPGLSLFGMADQYGRSKLMLEYLARQIAKLTYVSDAENPSRPRIMVNSFDPGPTQSDIFSKHSATLVEGLFLYCFNLIAKPTEQGANAYITAIGQGEQTRGQMWMNDEIVGREKLSNIYSEEGKTLGEKVWGEFLAVVRKTSGDLADQLQEVVSEV